MEKLITGYKRFRTNSWPARRAALETLAEMGQKPQALILTCIDSRVDPTMIFDAAPGELLVVRNVANLVPPYQPDHAYHGTSAALEFGVRVSEVPEIIVLGHERCGGVQALIGETPDGAQDFVQPWMSIAETARVKTMKNAPPEKQQEYCEQEVVKVSLANLMTFPWIAERVATGTLRLHGAWFSIYSGRLLVLRENGTFDAL